MIPAIHQRLIHAGEISVGSFANENEVHPLSRSSHIIPLFDLQFVFISFSLFVAQERQQAYFEYCSKAKKLITWIRNMMSHVNSREFPSTLFAMKVCNALTWCLPLD